MALLLKLVRKEERRSSAPKLGATIMPVDEANRPAPKSSEAIDEFLWQWRCGGGTAIF
jgi:hypothetical protein